MSREEDMWKWYSDQSDRCIYCFLPVFELEPHIQDNKYEFYECICPVCKTTQNRIR